MRVRFAPSLVPVSTKASTALEKREERQSARRSHVSYPVAVNKQDRPYQDAWTIQRAVELAFLRSVWVYRSCVAIATNQAKLPIVARKGDWADGKVVDSDVADRLNYNPTRNRAFNSTIFRRMISFQVLLNRQGAMMEQLLTNSGELYSLNLMPPNYCWPIPDPVNYIKGYLIRYPGVEEFTVKPDRIIWMREPHPTDMYSGISPLEPLGLSVESDWYQRLYNRNFILNDARPGGFLVLKAADGIDPADWNDIRAKFGNGPMQSGRLEIIDGENATWIDGATTPRDAQYVEMRKQTKDEILQGFGVPESIAGNASQRTFANADAEQEVFWRETMLPHLELLARAWDQLTPEDDIYMSFDWSRVPILERDIRTLREYKLRELQAGAISTDEYREAAGYDKAAAGKTDRLYIGISLQEVGSAVDEDWQDPAAAMMPPPGQEGMGGDQFGGELPPGDEGGGELPALEGDMGTGEGATWGDDFFGTFGKTLELPAGDEDTKLLEMYEALAERFAPTKALPFNERELADDFLNHHAAWESTIANGLEAHFDRQKDVVLAKLMSRKTRDAYEKAVTHE